MLRRLLAEKGWSQSELARRAGMGRDNVSRYVHGIHLPTPVHLKKLADALEVRTGALCPGGASESEAEYCVELKLLKGTPDQARVRIDRVMPTDIALQIVALANCAKLP